MTSREFKSVHDAHCCQIHGCKYGNDDCPVVDLTEHGVKCERCEVDESEQPEPTLAQVKFISARLKLQYTELVKDGLIKLRLIYELPDGKLYVVGEFGLSLDVNVKKAEC